MKIDANNGQQLCADSSEGECLSKEQPQKKPYKPQEWETVNCPYCSSAKSRVFEKYGSELQFTYVECAGCGLIYQSPRPKYDERFLHHAYDEYYVYNPDYTYCEKGRRMWGAELSEILKFDKKRSAIIDVGSCMGDFLDVCTKHYPVCEGVEVAQNMADFTSRQLHLKIHMEKFGKIDFDRKYSCVHISHAIEHIPNPVEWIRKSAQILEKDGILVINVPNMHSLERRFKRFLKRTGIKSAAWKESWRTPDHMFEPTIRSTLRFLDGNGFRVLEHYTYSRRDASARTPFGILYNRLLKCGSNIRFFATPK